MIDPGPVHHPPDAAPAQAFEHERARAARRCAQLQSEYRAGLLDDDELAALLVRCGLVIRDRELWLYDSSADLWWVYRGSAPALASGPG